MAMTESWATCPNNCSMSLYLTRSGHRIILQGETRKLVQYVPMIDSLMISSVYAHSVRNVRQPVWYLPILGGFLMHSHLDNHTWEAL